MKTLVSPDTPQLAPPGAGLPWLELQIARLLFGWRWSRLSRQQINESFEHERCIMLNLARSCTPETGARRVLIKRLRGIEDSSRFWSVYMTLDHVRIMNTVVARTMQTLSHGQVPSGKASTANVKPAPQADASAIEGFDHSCDLLLKCVQAIPDLHTKERFTHPWFGPLDAAGWHAMAAMHMNLHRRQIESILATGSQQ